MASRLEVRRTKVEDHRGISTLISKAGGTAVFRKRFGTFGTSFIENSYLSLLAFDTEHDDEVVGYISLTDSPKGVNLEEWLKATNAAISPAGTRRYRQTNTLFLDYLVVHPDVGGLTRRLLFTVFTAFPQIDCVLCLLPPSDVIPAEMSEYFHDTVPDGTALDLPGGEVRLACCDRDSMIPTLAVRSACVEDHDDLLPIFDRQSELLSEAYGDFFLAELIESQDSDNKALAALCDDRAVGLMALSSDLEIGTLQRCFHLEQYDWLVQLPEGWSAQSQAERVKSSLEEQRSEPVLLAVLGSAVTGVSGVCASLSEHYGCVVVDPEALLADTIALLERQDELDEASNDGDDDDGLMVRIRDAVVANQDISDQELTELVLRRLRESDCLSSGAVLLNFPATGTQAEMMQVAGLQPHALVLLQVSEMEHVSRVLKRCIDAETGIAYDSIEDAPQEDEILQRLVPASVEGEEAIALAFQDLQTGSEEVYTLLETDLEMDGLTRHTEMISVDCEALTALQAVHAVLADLSQTESMHPFEPQSQEQGAVEAMSALEAQLKAFPPNAVAVTVMCVDGVFESRAIDFLPHAFDQFPDREYIVLTLPSGVDAPPLLSSFNLAVPRVGTSFSHSLYLLHRDVLLAPEHLTVERLMPDIHGPAVQRLTQDLPKVSEALTLCERDEELALEDNPNHVAFVAMIGAQCVSVVSMDRRNTTSERLSWLRANFDVDGFIAMDKYRARNQAYVTAFVVNPAFYSCARFVLQQCMRLFDKTVVYHECRGDAMIPRSVVNSMVCVKPRLRPEPVADDPVKHPLQSFEYDAEGPFDGVLLHMTSRQMLTVGAAEVNSRVVVCGGGATVVSLLESMLFTPRTHFTSLTLVTPLDLDEMACDRDGLGAANEDDPLKEYLMCLGIPQHVRLIKGSLESIDRESQSVTLSSGTVLPYDKLVLSDTLVDSTPRQLAGKQLDEQALSEGRLTATNGDGTQSVITGVVSINRFSPRRSASLASTLIVPDGPVVVYGSSLHALSAVNWLIEAGVSESLITWVRPGWGADYASEWLRDSDAEAMLSNHLKQMGVTDRSDLTMEAIDANEAGAIESVRFRRDASTPRGPVEPETLPCSLLLACHELDVRPSLFRAINASGLVYDGRLVVNTRMFTSDPNIMAGGPITKFSRKFQTRVYHSEYNPNEIGRYMAKRLIESLDPSTAHLSSQPLPLPSFSRPVAASAHLSNSLHCSIIECSLTGKQLHLQALRTKSANGVSTLSLDEFGTALHFSFIGPKPIETRNFSHLVGLQESYLNSCADAHARGAVADWTVFFREEWAHALYHDKFHSFVERMRELLAHDPGATEVVDMLLHAVEEGNDEAAIVTLRSNAIGTAGDRLLPATRKLIESSTLEFLQQNRSTLPEYLLPDSRIKHK